MESFIRRSEVERITGLSRTEIYRQIQKGIFPKPVPIGGKAVRWQLSLIENWQQQCIDRPWKPYRTPRRVCDAVKSPQRKCRISALPQMEMAGRVTSTTPDRRSTCDG
jgi:prophage regulatory protein